MNETWVEVIFGFIGTMVAGWVASLFVEVSKIKTKLAVVDEKLSWVNEHKEDFIIIRHGNSGIQSELAVIVRNQDTLFKKLDRERAKVNFLMTKLQILKSKAEKNGWIFDDTDWDWEDLT